MLKKGLFLGLLLGIGVFSFFFFSEIKKIEEISNFSPFAGREDLICLKHKDRIWLMGGMKTNGERTNDVWVSVIKENQKAAIQLPSESFSLDETFPKANSLKLLSCLPTLGQPEFVFVSGDYAYLANGYSGLEIFDISDVRNPKFISNYNTAGYLEGVFVSGDYAYLADKDGGFLILDVSDKKNPQLMSRDPRISTEGVFVKDNFAFVAYAWWGIKIFDVSEKKFPKLIFEKDLPDETEAVFVKENYLFLAKANWKRGGRAREGDFQIFDISNIENPKLIFTHYPAEDYSESIFVKDNFLFLAKERAGLKIFDISNPQKPIFLNRIKTPGTVESVFVKNNFAFLALGRRGVGVVNVSNPNQPKLKTILEISGFVERVFVKENYIYLAVKKDPSLVNTNTKEQKGNFCIVEILYDL